MTCTGHSALKMLGNESTNRASRLAALMTSDNDVAAVPTGKLQPGLTDGPKIIGCTGDSAGNAVIRAWPPNINISAAIFILAISLFLIQCMRHPSVVEQFQHRFRIGLCRYPSEGIDTVFRLL